MLIRLVRRIAKEDLAQKGELPAWIDSLLNPINNFLDNTISALRNGITFRDNVLCQVASQKFRHDVESEIQVNGPYKIQGMIPVMAEADFITGFKLTRKTNGNAGVTLKLSSGDEANCTVIVLLENR